MPPLSNQPRSSTGAWLMLAGIALLTVMVIGSLMKLRFDTGENYPRYSSLRTDPLGTRAIYEALNRVPGVTVERNFQRLDRLEGTPGTALVMAGLDVRQFNSRDVVDADAVSRFVASGGRLIIALNPDVSMDRFTRAFRDAQEEDEAGREKRRGDKSKTKKDEAKGKDDKARPEARPAPSDAKADSKSKKDKDSKNAKGSKGRRSNHEMEVEEEHSFAETLKIAAKSKQFFYNSKEGSPLDLAQALPLESDAVPGWRSNAYLDDTPGQVWSDEWQTLSKALKSKESKDKDKDKDKDKPEAQTKEPPEPSPWQTLATKGTRIMIAQRKLGSGTVIVCTDRYFLSNEALWSERKPVFLSWLFGGATKIIFEETHLGAMIGDEDGIMTLARRYRMHGLFLGGVLLFALFIWRSAFSLVPPVAEEDLGLWRADAVAGRSAASGLEGLLRRGIAPGKLLKRCFEVWESTRAAVAAVPADRRAQAKAVAEDAQAMKKPVSTYRSLRDILHNSRKA